MDNASLMDESALNMIVVVKSVKVMHTGIGLKISCPSRDDDLSGLEASSVP